MKHFHQITMICDPENKKHRHRETRIFIHSYIYGSTYPNSITLYLYNSITSSIMNHYFCKFMQWSMAFLYIIIMIINQLSPQDHPNFLSQSWLGGARHNHIFYFIYGWSSMMGFFYSLGKSLHELTCQMINLNENLNILHQSSLFM